MADEAFETWKNQGLGKVVVKRHGEYGVEKDEIVRGGKTLHITAADRRMNQERAANASLDVFTNGMLTPVRVGSAAEEFEGNANLLTEDDMRALVKSHPKTFAKKLGEITNPVVVGKLLEIAREEDCTVGRVETIEARLDDVNPINTVKIQTHAPDERQAASFKTSIT